MRRNLVFVVLLLSLFVLLSASAHAQVLNPENGHYYQVVSISPGIDWYSAKSAAETLVYNNASGHLVTITSQSENDFLVELPLMEGAYWAGGFQTQGSTNSNEGWQWITGELWSYTNWNPNEPNGGGNESQIEFRSQGDWNDRSWDTYNMPGYIVEFEPVPEPSTILVLAGGLCSLGGIAFRRRK